MVNRIKSRYGTLTARQKVIILPIAVILLCCSSCCAWTFADSTLRNIGILPTRTPNPTDTPKPTLASTATPELTATPESTDTPRPTSTPIPTDTSQPTSPPDTAQPTIAATQAPTIQSTAAPTQPPQNTPVPTQPPTIAPTEPPTASNVVIINVNKQDEYVDIQNQGGTAQDLTNWMLVSEKGPQSCTLGGIIEAGAVLRIWALAEDAPNGGFNCGFGSPIWNNSEPDPAVLYDANGSEVSRFNS